MCGIIAFIPHTHAARYDIERGLDVMRHRGQDARVITYYDHCVVGYLRMAVTDKDAPAVGKANGHEVYLNGEIYNYRELGYTGSETEVLAKGFAAEGESFARRLNGMFSIVLVTDGKIQTFNDRYCIKPLYRYMDENVTIYSSEIKPILQYEGFRRDIYKQEMEAWMTLQHPFTAECLLKGVLDMAHVNSARLWTWAFHPDDDMDYDYARDEVRRLVLQAISRQRVSEPSGVCLSGGVDSGILAAHTGSQHSFTVGYEGVDDERPMARLMARENHHEIVYDRVMHMAETIYHLEDLRAGASWPNYGMYQEAQKHVRILFDGAGADELFAGYDWRYHNPNYWSVVNRTGMQCDWIREYFDDREWGVYDRFDYDANYFLPAILMVGDKLSMAHTLEVRYPFLDNDLVDFCTRLPFEFKRNKRILKDAFRDDLPPEILNGPKKGFTSPDWFPGDGNQARRWSEAALKSWKKIFLNT